MTRKALKTIFIIVNNASEEERQSSENLEEVDGYQLLNTNSLSSGICTIGSTNIYWMLNNEYKYDECECIAKDFLRVFPSERLVCDVIVLNWIYPFAMLEEEKSRF